MSKILIWPQPEEHLTGEHYRLADGPAGYGDGMGIVSHAGVALNTLNLKLQRCKMLACREQDSRPARTRAASRKGSPSGCWRGRSRGSWWMR